MESRKEIIEIKQYSRSQNIEVKGTPVVYDEDLCKSFEKIAIFVGFEVSEDDIDVLQHVYSKNKDEPNVVLRFLTRAAQDKFSAVR